MFPGAELREEYTPSQFGRVFGSMALAVISVAEFYNDYPRPAVLFAATMGVYALGTLVEMNVNPHPELTQLSEKPSLR
jgi:hypothetical protein